jgi:hypothetical protein
MQAVRRNAYRFLMLRVCLISNCVFNRLYRVRVVRVPDMADGFRK